MVPIIMMVALILIMMWLIFLIVMMMLMIVLMDINMTMIFEILLKSGSKINKKILQNFHYQSPEREGTLCCKAFYLISYRCSRHHVLWKVFDEDPFIPLLVGCWSHRLVFAEKKYVLPCGSMSFMMVFILRFFLIKVLAISYIPLVIWLIWIYFHCAPTYNYKWHNV